eukprot:1161500-Pelagomonas_calceolata.AAC.1
MVFCALQTQHGETEESLCPGKLLEARVTWIGKVTLCIVMHESMVFCALQMQHGETEESLCPGKLVEARVTWIGRDEVKVGQRSLQLMLRPLSA